MTTYNRRSFLRRTAIAGGALLAPSLTGLLSCSDPERRDGSGLPPAAKGDGGYGALVPSKDVDEIISVPAGFHAARLSTVGDEMIGGLVPHGFDGMAAFAAASGLVRLVRNHELRDPPALNPSPFGDHPYDDLGPAGTTTLEVRVLPDGTADRAREFASLTGTSVNCAGGATAWGSWLSCEETIAGVGAGWERNHGYVFEVPASADETVAPVPLKAMGRFEHEAVAIDPVTGTVYLTEDHTPAGLYRFIPNVAGRLAQGGRLEALGIAGRPQLNTFTNQPLLTPMKVRWVPIPEPDSDDPNLPPSFVFNQGLARGAAQFARLEGCWYGDDSIFFNATIGGNAGAGQVWQYHIRREELQLIFESPSHSVLNNPDNITVSPRGGIVICEDGDGTNFVRGLTRSGKIFGVVRNDLNDSEWAGVCFSPQGRTLFVNLQGETHPLENPAGVKGITFAIWGPWESGAL